MLQSWQNISGKINNMKVLKKFFLINEFRVTVYHTYLDT